MSAGSLEDSAEGMLGDAPHDFIDITFDEESPRSDEEMVQQQRTGSTTMEPSRSEMAIDNSNAIAAADNAICFRGELPPEFPLFANFDCSPISIHILQFLTASELCAVSNTCRSMYMTTLSPALWKPLLIVDFVLEDHQITAINSTPHLQEGESSSGVNASKKYYAQQVREVNRSIERTRTAKIRMDEEVTRDRRVKYLECCLDTSMVRVAAPLPAGSIIATLILVGLRTDGLDISIWICLAPLIFLVAYTLFTAAVTYEVYRRRNSITGLIRRELWTNLRSPAQVFYEATESPKAAKCAVGICLLLLIQLMALGVKVSTSDSIPESLHEGLSWGVVFLPIWLLFAIFLASPAFGIYSGPGPYLGLLLVVWIPLFILFTCLTVKLTGIEEGEREGRMRLALFMMPFWLMEGVVMLGSLVVVVVGVHRYVPPSRVLHFVRFSCTLFSFLVCDMYAWLAGTAKASWSETAC
jgi:hypothetical protein